MRCTGFLGTLGPDVSAPKPSGGRQHGDWLLGFEDVQYRVIGSKSRFSGWRSVFGVLVTLMVCTSATAAADPPNVPGAPDSSVPDATDATEAPANIPPGPPGFSLPDLQQWLNKVIPPPPLPLPRPDTPATGSPPPQPPTDGPPPANPRDLAALVRATGPEDSGDPMFDEWPAGLAGYAPGQPIQVRDITAVAAQLMTAPVQQVLLLKYRTTDAHGEPSFATATLAIPVAAWTGPGARPVTVHNLAIDALGRRCTVGYTLAHGFSSETSNLMDFFPPTTALALQRGYAVLLPDHEGPRMAYAEPYVAGHAVLDAIRAVRRQLPDQFRDSRFAMTGYSGGAIATRGAVALLGSYAPELAGSVVGAALGGVPADYRMLARSMNANLASGVLMAAIFGVGRERPEILEHMNNLARWVAVSSSFKDSCGGIFVVPGLFQLPVDLAADLPDALHSPMAENIYRITAMAGMKSTAPLYIYNGEQEFWIPAAGARELYQQQCAMGAVAVYRSVFGEHLTAALTGYPGALAWLDQRLQGVPAPNEC